jgi:hypothetical protein
MIKDHSELIAQVVLPKPIQGKGSHQMKNTWTIILANLGVTLLLAALGGCTPKEDTGKIQLYQDPIGAYIGQKVVLQAQNNPFDVQNHWQYQWQYVIGETNGTNITADITNASNENLVLENLSINDAKLYQCMMYKTGEFGETNYTAITSLHVSGRSVVTNKAIFQAIVTPVSGSFKPGFGTGTAPGCNCKYVDGIRFLSPAGTWWNPPSASTRGVITVTTPNFNYAKTPVVFEVEESSLTKNWCTNLPNLLTFQISTGKEYQFLMYFTSEKPATGQQLTFEISW